MAWLYTIAALLFGVVFYGYNVRNRWRYRHIPGPTPTWLFGNMREVGKEGLHNTLPQWARKFGGVYKFYFGRFPFLVINEPELVRQVCIKNFMQFHDRQYSLIHQGGANQEANCTFLYGILSAKGKYWAGLRSSVEPVFHSQQLALYAPMMNDAAEKLAQRMAAFAEKQNSGIAAAAAPEATAAEADVKHGADDGAAAGNTSSMQLQPALGTTALEVVGTSAFGVDFDTDKEESRIVKEASFVMTPPKRPQNLNRMGGILVPHLGRLWFLISSWMGSESVQGSFTARGFLLGTAQVLLENTRRQNKGAGTQPAESSTAGPSATEKDTTAAADTESTPLISPAANSTADNVPPIAHLPGGVQQSSGWRMLRRDDPDLHLYKQAKADARQAYGTAVPRDYSILHHLLRATNKETGQPFTDLQIVAQCNTFLLAGFDTTSTALTWAIYALATHPEIEQKLLEEVDAFSWKEGAGVGYEDLPHFEYTRAVIDEAMRMWPPVMPMVGLQREAGADTRIGGYAVPKGTKIWINVLSIHHDPTNYPQPEVFRPERFLPGSEEAASRHPYAYIPFGAGPRKCVGYKFALEEAVITLAQLYRRFTFELDPKKHPDTSAPLQLSSGITLTMKGGVWVRPVSRT